MSTKRAPEPKTLDALVEFKTLDGAKGEFEAVVSVFGNVDFIGDRVLKGAFTRSLKQWQLTGDPIPVIWNHQLGNPDAHIGVVDPADATETDRGLQVKGRLDVHKPFARQVFDLMSERRVKEFSFGYRPIVERPAKGGVNELVDVDLFEISVTTKGMNPDTELLAVKAFEQASKAPPWHIEERNNMFCVVVNETGDTVKCHDSHDAAQAHMAALYANVTEAAAGETLDLKAGATWSRANAARARDFQTRLRALTDEIDAWFDSQTDNEPEPKSAVPVTVEQPADLTVTERDNKTQEEEKSHGDIAAGAAPSREPADELLRLKHDIAAKLAAIS